MCVYVCVVSVYADDSTLCLASVFCSNNCDDNNYYIKISIYL